MRNIIAIARKELNIYFTTPIAYVVIFVFTLIMGYFFNNILSVFQRISVQYLQYQRPELLEQLNLTDMVARPVLLNMSVILIFMVPMLTMRLVAEERRQKTYELLMTLPVTITEIVIGKYLAALALICLMLGITAFYPISLHLIAVGEGGTGQGLAGWTIVTAYLGTFFVGASFAALGLFMSSLTENQIIAAVLTFTFALLLYLLNWAAQSATGTWQVVLQHISILDNAESFSKGLLEVKSIVYYLGFIFFGLFLSHRVIETQRYL